MRETRDFASTPRDWLYRNDREALVDLSLFEELGENTTPRRHRPLASVQPVRAEGPGNALRTIMGALFFGASEGASWDRLAETQPAP